MISTVLKSLKISLMVLTSELAMLSFSINSKSFDESVRVPFCNDLIKLLIMPEEKFSKK